MKKTYLKDLKKGDMFIFPDMVPVEHVSKNRYYSGAQVYKYLNVYEGTTPFLVSKETGETFTATSETFNREVFFIKHEVN